MAMPTSSTAFALQKLRCCLAGGLAQLQLHSSAELTQQQSTLMHTEAPGQDQWPLPEVNLIH